VKIVAINGSHRRGKNTAALLNSVLEETIALGATTELIELTDFNIKFCRACNMCLKKAQCSISDDMKIIEEKLLAADGIIVGSPVYFTNVTAVMKNFIDRTRYLHMTKNMLAGKVGAAVTNAGLINGGQEGTLKILEHFLQGHGLQTVDARNKDSDVLNVGVTGSLMSGCKNNKPIWRQSALDDELIYAACKQLGRNMVKLIRQLND
jgi:Multimeric flavodoxin WrbA